MLISSMHELDTILNETEKMDNRAIRVFYLDIRPAVMNQCDRFPTRPSVRCRFPGYCVEILTLLAKYLRVKIEPYKDERVTDVGTLIKENNTWTGVLGLIERGIIDTTCILFQKTIARENSFDFTDELYTTETGIVLRRPANAPMGEIANLFAPYSSYAWCTIIGFLFLQVLFGVAVNRTEKEAQMRPVASKPYKVFWRLLRMHLLQADGFQFFSISAAISGKLTIFLFGLLQCILILSLYQFWIVSSLVRYVPTTTFRNADEIFSQIVQGKMKLILTYYGHWFYQQIVSSDDYRFKMLRNMEKVHNRFVLMNNNLTNMLEEIHNGPYVSVVQDDGPLKYHSSNTCDLMSIKDGMSPMTTHFLFRRHSNWTRNFNEAIAHEGLQINRIQNRYMQLSQSMRKRQCADNVTNKKFRPLGLLPFFGLMILCTFGYLLAFIAYMIERSSSIRNILKPR